MNEWKPIEDLHKTLTTTENGPCEGTEFLYRFNEGVSLGRVIRISSDDEYYFFYNNAGVKGDISHYQLLEIPRRLKSREEILEDHLRDILRVKMYQSITPEWWKKTHDLLKMTR